MRLSWQAPEHEGAFPVAGYQVQWKADADTGYGAWTEKTAVADLAGAGTAKNPWTWTATGLAGATGYSFRVRAVSTDTRPTDGDTRELAGAESDTAAAATAAIQVAFGAAAATVNEGQGVTVRVTLSAPAPAALSVPITATAGAGLAAGEYSGVPASATFDAGETGTSFTVTFAADTAEESEETLTLAFGTLPAGYAAGTPAQTVLTVTDDPCAAAGAEVVWCGTLTIPPLVAGSATSPVDSLSVFALGVDASSRNFEVSPTDPTKRLAAADGYPDNPGVNHEPGFVAEMWGVYWLYYVPDDPDIVPGPGTLHLATARGEKENYQVTLHLTNTDTGQARTFDLPLERAGDRTFTFEDAGLDWERGHRIAVKLTRTPVSDGLSVADADVREPETGSTASLTFRVSLKPAQTSQVTVDYATADGTGRRAATAPGDYTAASGTLTFAPGETWKEVDVAVLADSHDEGRETMTLTLSNASGATIADATATGTIVNDGKIPQGWIVRFARTVADQVIDAIEGRMQAPRTPGIELTIAGERVGGGGRQYGEGPEDEKARKAAEEKAEAADALDRLSEWLKNGADPDEKKKARSRAVSGRELLTGSAFSLTGGDSETGHYALWGRGAVSRIGGRDGNRRDAFEKMRDFAAEAYRVETGAVWRPRHGSHTSRTGRLTSAAIDARDFVRARKDKATRAHLPEGTLVAVTGGKQVTDLRPSGGRSSVTGPSVTGPSLTGPASTSVLWPTWPLSNTASEAVSVILASRSVPDGVSVISGSANLW